MKKKATTSQILKAAHKAGRVAGRSVKSVLKDAHIKAKAPKKGGEQRVDRTDKPVKVGSKTFFI